MIEPSEACALGSETAGAGCFAAAATFAAPTHFTAAGLAARAGSLFPDIGRIEVVGHPETPGQAVLRIDGRLVWAREHDGPPQGAFCGSSRRLAEADTARRDCRSAHMAAAHAVVRHSADASSADTPAHRRRSAAIVSCVAAALAKRPGAGAVVWGPARLATPAASFVAAAAQALRAAPPVSIWIGAEMRAAEGRGAVLTGLSTRGLAAFAGGELVMPPAPIAPAAALALAERAARRMMNEDEPLADGEMLRQSQSFTKNMVRVRALRPEEHPAGAAYALIHPASDAAQTIRAMSKAASARNVWSLATLARAGGL